MNIVAYWRLFLFMNPPKSNDTGNPLLNLLLNQASNPGAQTSQGFQTLMQQNPQIAKAYQDRTNYYNATNADIGNTLNSQATNGVNGSAVNVSPGFQGFASEVPANNAASNSFLLGLMQAASGETQNSQNNASSILNTQTQNTTQNRGLNLQYGVGDQNGNMTNTGAGANGGMNGQQAVVSVSNQGGSDLLNGLSPAQQYQKAQQILSAGGVGNWRLKNPGELPPSDTDRLNSANTNLNQIDKVVGQLKTSKNLQAALNTPGVSDLVKFAMSTGQSKLLKNFGLNDNDLVALDFLSQLGVKGDAAAAGGPVRAYLAKMLGPANAGLDKNTNNNVALLTQTKQNILSDLKSYAKQKGYNYYTDLPGLNLGKVRMQAPNGSTGTVDQAEVGQAVQNGWKEQN